jgi:hypothetical protein
MLEKSSLIKKTWNLDGKKILLKQGLQIFIKLTIIKIQIFIQILQ